MEQLVCQAALDAQELSLHHMGTAAPVEVYCSEVGSVDEDLRVFLGTASRTEGPSSVGWSPLSCPLGVDGPTVGSSSSLASSSVLVGPRWGQTSDVLAGPCGVPGDRENCWATHSQRTMKGGMSSRYMSSSFSPRSGGTSKSDTPARVLSASSFLPSTVRFPCFTAYAYSGVFELLKNAMRASVERWREERNSACAGQAGCPESGWDAVSFSGSPGDSERRQQSKGLNGNHVSTGGKTRVDETSWPRGRAGGVEKTSAVHATGTTARVGGSLPDVEGKQSGRGRAQGNGIVEGQQQGLAGGGDGGGGVRTPSSGDLRGPWHLLTIGRSRRLKTIPGRMIRSPREDSGCGSSARDRAAGRAPRAVVQLEEDDAPPSPVRIHLVRVQGSLVIQVRAVFLSPRPTACRGGL